MLSLPFSIRFYNVVVKQLINKDKETYNNPTEVTQKERASRRPCTRISIYMSLMNIERR